jgi:acetaldehyde dehydrogenase
LTLAIQDTIILANLKEGTTDMASSKVNVAIIGPGNIGTDLMYKILKCSKYMNIKIMVGIYADSEGLRRASALGINNSSNGIDEILEDRSIRIAFEATTASAHMKNAPLLEKAGIRSIDLTPAAVGPYVCPVVNMDEHLSCPNINLITCGAQATVPIVAAIASITDVEYAEIVATIASKSAGPGTRQNIDEFTQTTARALEKVGKAARGKAIIILNPAEPPILMRNTIYVKAERQKEEEIVTAVEAAVRKVQGYVPGYRMRVPPIFDEEKVTTMIEVEGAGEYLPRYAGNLDIETSAAVAVGDRIAKQLLKEGGINNESLQ